MRTAPANEAKEALSYAANAQHHAHAEMATGH